MEAVTLCVWCKNPKSPDPMHHPRGAEHVVNPYSVMLAETKEYRERYIERRFVSVEEARQVAEPLHTKFYVIMPSGDPVGMWIPGEGWQEL